MCGFTAAPCFTVSGLIPDVLQMFPEAVVVGSKVCLAFLAGLAHSSFESRAVKGGDTIDLGGGHTLEFVMAPNLHCASGLVILRVLFGETSYHILDVSWCLFVCVGGGCGCILKTRPMHRCTPCWMCCHVHVLSGPDTMFSYDHGTGVMYTCDAFGMHYCSEELYDSELETIAPHYR